MIPFERLSLNQKPEIDALLRHAAHRGCAFSFVNLYIWGRQCAARVGDDLLLFSHFGGKTMYPYPVCPGDPRPAIELLMADARERGIPLRLTGLNTQDVEDLQRWYPDRFAFHCGREGHDYVYAIDDLADLRGRKYQKKRNHVNRFRTEHPDYRVLPLNAETLEKTQNMVDSWYTNRHQTDPQGDYLLESIAINKAFRNLENLQMEGILLMEGERVLAVTMGSRMGADTFDIHFEKAREDVDGAYTVINQEFARYLRLKYPDLRYLNREDDMGLEGLRKAKLSYYPDHMTEKYKALLTEDIYED